MNFFAELKRRNVLRAAAFYAASAWLLVQVATQVFPFFQISEWVVRWIVVAAVIGFPFALGFSWFYEWTPRGFQLESQIPANESKTRETGRKLDRWIIAILALAVVLLLADRFILHRDSSASADKTAAASSEKSIAVLPFVNMSSDKENEFFADGLSEEILNSLARIDGMRVVGRTSSFQFKGKAEDLRAIGEKLGATNLLEGSVRREGNRARVTAQLIRASDGIHLWSETYDRTLADTLAVQLDIAEQVAAVLNVVLDDKQRENMRAAGVKNVDAFIAYEKGLKLYADAHDRTKSHDVIEGLRTANKQFDQAIALEPGFSQAYFAAADLYDHILLADDRSPAERADAQRQALHYLELSAANSHDEQQRRLTLADRQLVSDDWHGLAANMEAALRYPGCNAPDWLPVFASVFGYGDLIEDLGARVSICDPLNFVNLNSRVTAALASAKPQRALDVIAASEKARGTGTTPNAFGVQALVMLGRLDEARKELSMLPPRDESYYQTVAILGAACGESADSIRGRLQAVDRSASIRKFWTLTDLTAAPLIGDRAEANRRAAAFDAQPAGPFLLVVSAAYGLSGAPFDLKATPNLKKRLAESGLPWPPASPINYPIHTTAKE
jgi:adenylate cyclase